MSWEKVPIKDVCEGIYDGPHATPPLSESGAIFLGIQNFKNGRLDFSDVRYISEEDLLIWTKRVIPQAGDIVFSYEATLNLYAIIPAGFRGCLGRRMALIRVDKNKINYRYLYYYLHSPTWKAVIAENTVTGATVDRIPLIRFPDFEIELPPLDVQNNIADILSAYDDLIENNQRQIKLLEEAAMRLYREWFVFMRFPGHESVRIEDGVPEGWEKIRTSSVMKFNYGKGLLEANRSGDGYPVFGSSGIVGYHDTPLVNENCIVVGRKGNVGSVYLSLMPSYPIDTVFYIIPKINIYYCYFELKSRTFVNNDSAVPGLNRENVEDMPMLLPSDKILEGFHNLIDPYIQRMSYLEQQNVLLQKARDALLPRLMNGGEGLKLEGGAV